MTIVRIKIAPKILLQHLFAVIFLVFPPPVIYAQIHLEPIVALQHIPNLDRGKIMLGKKLFSDQRLSKNSSFSCASCHDLNRGGTDNKTYSINVDGQKNRFNTLSVYNAAYNLALYWDGRVRTVELQVEESITSTQEMGASWEQLLAKLKQDQSLLALFKLHYEDGITKKNIIDALANFERSLITVGAPFDHYLGGDEDAITEIQKSGYRLFKSYGCSSCHQGRNVGGNMFQLLGVMDDYFKFRGDVSNVDYGRFNVTGKEEDRYRFRVPSLRNVALTAPYFHDGYADTLEQAVQLMARFQLGITIPPQDVDALVAFLQSLTAASLSGDR